MNKVFIHDMLREYNDKEFNNFRKEFSSQSSIIDSRFGKVTIVRSHQQQVMFLITRSFQNEKEVNFFIKELKVRDSLIHHDLRANMVAFHKTVDSGMCGSAFKVTMILEFYDQTLDMETKRRAHENKQFSEDEIWFVIFNMVDLFQLWEQKKVYHGDIGAHSISLDAFGKLKVYDNAVTQAQQNNQHFGTSSLLSPEKMESLLHKNQQYVGDVFKSDVFSLGMTVLGLCNLRSSLQYYNFPTKQIYFDKVENDLRILNQKFYSETLMRFIQDMLLVDVHHRPSF